MVVHVTQPAFNKENKIDALVAMGSSKTNFKEEEEEHKLLEDLSDDDDDDSWRVGIPFILVRSMIMKRQSERM